MGSDFPQKRVTRRVGWLIGWLMVCVVAAGTPAAGAAPPAAKQRTYSLPPEQTAVLAQWYREVGARRPREKFGQLVVRAARTQIGKPYDTPRTNNPVETLRVELRTLHCVSLVESAWAVATCISKRTPTAACFMAAMQNIRYRNGTVDGYGSRLHYFEEWLLDNDRRSNIRLLDAEIGNETIQRPIFYMTRHARKYPMLADAGVRAAVRTAEERLSQTRFAMVGRDRIQGANRHLRDGDIIAIITNNKPGLLTSHVGLVLRLAGGGVRLLHASSHNRRVVLSRGTLRNYITRRSERVGVMIARPLGPRAPKR